MNTVSLDFRGGIAVMVRSRNIIATALLCTCVGGFSQASQSSLDDQWEGVLSREGSEAK
jgi:hypothetical protein